MAAPQYGIEHQAERDAWAPIVAAGGVVCRRAPFGYCLEDDAVIAPGSDWDLGHPDHQVPAAKAPEHVRCNRSTMTHRPPARRPAELHPAVASLMYAPGGGVT